MKSPGPRPWALHFIESTPTRLLLLAFVVRLGRGFSCAGDILRLHLRRRAILAADGIVDFFAMDADLAWGIDPQTHLVAADIHHGDFDVVADHDRLVALT